VGPAGKLPSLIAAGLSAPIVTALRQTYLDALPNPVAIVGRSGETTELVARNEAFDKILATIEPIDPCRMRTQILAFLDGDEKRHDFDWSDHDGVAGRHFRVRLTRMPAMIDWRPRCLVSLIERTAEINTARSLRAEMLNDSLTGLPNRAAFIEAVAEGLNEIAERGLAVLAIDLNRFSRINECMGAIAGDELIITVARRLLSALRAGDKLARIGGDEFAVLLRVGDPHAEAAQAAERMRRALSAPFRLSELEIGIAGAIGVAVAGEGSIDAEDLVRNAQFALKRAKSTGEVEIYRPGEVGAVRHKLSLETGLRRAIEGGQLRLVFQPLVDLATGGLAGFEALTRWDHEGQSIPPADFIAAAEESGLIVPLGRWAVDTALAALADWDAALGRPLPIRVAVNVSAIQLARDDVGAVAAAALARTGVAGSRLTLELTESAIVHDPARATRALGALKGLDATIAMDDFGTGYSSLAYLQKLPIDMLKIDRSFVTGMLADRDKVAIVRAVLSLADALGMTTTAEGVETVELAQTLAALGCTYGQGHYFAAPLGAEDALAYLSARSA